MRVEKHGLSKGLIRDKLAHLVAKGNHTADMLIPVKQEIDNKA